MVKHNGEPRRGETGVSTPRQIWRITRDIKAQSGLSADAFLAQYGASVKASFPASMNEAMEQGAIPVLICAHNEVPVLGRTLAGLAAQEGVRVKPLVVDSWSADGTGDFAKALGAEVVREEEHGLLPALRSGFAYFNERGYQGPLLHTDADTVPVTSWASTMAGYANKLAATGGEVFGPAFHYDYDPEQPRGRRNPIVKNTLFSTAGHILDRRAALTGKVRARGYNGVIMTDPEGRILSDLAVLQQDGPGYALDVTVRNVVDAAGGEIQFIHNPKALTVTSGDRYPSVRSLAGRAFAQHRTKRKLYGDH